MKTLKRIIPVLFIIIFFIVSFAGSFSYFKNGTFKFDAEKLAVFDADENCYFLRDAPGDIKFRIGLPEEEGELYQLTDSAGSILNPKYERVSDKIYNIVPPTEGYIEGEQYSLILGEGVFFTDENLKDARSLVFTIERENVEEYKFTETVIETELEISKIEDGLIDLNGVEVQKGNILFGKDEDGRYAVYKIEEIKENGTATVTVPAVD